MTNQIKNYTPKELLNLKKLIETNPLWYQDNRIAEFMELFDKKDLTRDEKSLKSSFKKVLKTSNFYVSNTGYNWDKWRFPIEYIVIHHTSSAPTISLNELNVLGLRLYIHQHLTDKNFKNQPIYSGHYWYGKPKTKENVTFVSYHYLIRPSGKIIQLLDESAYTWHAGNLDVNHKGIAIALAGKFFDKEPTPEAIKAVAEIIGRHNIAKENVVGHTEVINKKLLFDKGCPGNLFLKSWKEKILENIRS